VARYCKEKPIIKNKIEKLENQDKKTIIYVINSLLRDAKARKTYATGS